MITFDHVSKQYGDQRVIDRLSLQVEAGELFVLVGASGSGKSTLLRMINRLVEPDAGAVRINQRDVRDTAPDILRRGIGYVIQSTGLFPHWTVARNIATVPRLLGWPDTRIRERVGAMLALLQLDAGLATRYPASLSGGQQQRVGVARALAGDPPIVLMDEPFGALDPITRDALQASLKRIQRETGKTIVFVTHDMDEALRLGDRIALIAEGQVRQCGTGRELLQSPTDETVRAFVGGNDQGRRLLGLRTVREAMQPSTGGGAADAPAIAPGETLQEALGLMLEHQVEQLCVREALGTRDGGRVIGRLGLTDLLARPA